MKELRPTFSVIIPVYNTRQTLPGMLRSALAQTCTDFEIVIVDDGSTDGGLDAIQSMLDNRCRVFTQANRGVSRARNRGLSEARGRYVALLDADDYWFPDHLETARQFFALHPEIRWYCASWVKTATVELVQSMPRATASYEIFNYFESGYLATEHPVWTSAVIFDKEMAANPALFPEDLCLGEDLYTWCHLGLISPGLGWTPRVTAAYVCAKPVVFPGNRAPAAYVARILADFPALAHPNNHRIQQHIQLLLMDHLERGEAQCILRFLQRHHQAMPLWFRSLWRLLAGCLSVAGTTATVRLVKFLLHVRRR